MRYWSDVLSKPFDTEEELHRAEIEHEEKENLEKLAKERETVARKEAAAKVEAARENCYKASEAYQQALKEFCAKYGAYHVSYKPSDWDRVFKTLFHY